MFSNNADQTMTWYTPEGMSAAEIMEIPDAKNFFKDEDSARYYIEDMAEVKKKHREEGIFQD